MNEERFLSFAIRKKKVSVASVDCIYFLLSTAGCVVGLSRLMRAIYNLLRALTVRANGIKAIIYLRLLFSDSHWFMIDLQ